MPRPHCAGLFPEVLCVRAGSPQTQEGQAWCPGQEGRGMWASRVDRRSHPHGASDWETSVYTSVSTCVAHQAVTEPNSAWLFAVTENCHRPYLRLRGGTLTPHAPMCTLSACVCMHSRVHVCVHQGLCSLVENVSTYSDAGGC